MEENQTFCFLENPYKSILLLVYVPSKLCGRKLMVILRSHSRLSCSKK